MIPENFCQQVKDTVKKVTVEPFIFFVMFSYNVRLISMQSLLHERACRISLSMPNSVCSQLDEDDNSEEQTAAITYGNNIYLGVIMISTLPAMIMTTIMGPWSDRYSRKYPLKIACTGIFLDTLTQTIITALPGISPFWFLLSSIFSGLSGGLMIVISSTYSYMSDITNEKSRQIRYTVLEFFTLMATPFGSFIGGQVHSISVEKERDYIPIMLIACCSMGAALLWLWLYVVETKAVRFDITTKQMFQNVFKMENLKESYRTCVKPRAGNLRLQIWLLVLVSFSLRLVNMGSLSIGFSFTRKKFKWKVLRYSYTTTAFSFVNCFATVVIVPILNKQLCVHEAAVGLIGVLSLMSKMVLLAAATIEEIVPYAWFCGCLYACGSIALRSRVSKLVSRSELGKVFSLFGICESAAPMFGTIIMMQIFNHSVMFYEGLAYAVAACLLLPSAVIFTWMMHFPSMSLIQFEESEEAKNMKELTNVSKNVF